MDIQQFSPKILQSNVRLSAIFSSVTMGRCVFRGGTKMTVEEIALVSQAMFPNSRLSIEIFRDQVWVGNCVFEGGQVADCYSVQLGVNGPESDEILAAISQAIQAGQSAVGWRGQRFTWKFHSHLGGR